HALRRRGREPGARPRCQGPEGWDVVAVAYEDLMVLAGSLAALADAVVVLEPETLREAVLDHLRGAAALAQEQER
ncbi:WYL domain-containing protein, partial [Actinomyces sp. 217892]